MVQLTNQQLDKVCKSVIERLPQWYNYLSDYFNLLYNTGVRANEPLDRNIWEQISEDTVKLQPFKNNNTRLIPTSSLPLSFLQIINNPLVGNYTINYSKANYIVYNIIGHYGIIIKNKESLLHLFRHNFVKKLVESGKSNEQIKSELGERTMKAALDYIDSKIYSKYGLTGL